MVELSPIAPRTVRMFAIDVSSAAATWPTSSLLLMPVVFRRSPSAMPVTTATTRRSGATTERVMTQPSRPRTRTPTAATTSASLIAVLFSSRAAWAASAAKVPTTSPRTGISPSSALNAAEKAG